MIEILEAWIAKSFFSLVDEQDVMVLQPAEVLLVPGPSRTEIGEQSTRGFRVPKSLESALEQFVGAFEIRLAGCNVVETQLRKLSEKRQVRV